MNKINSECNIKLPSLRDPLSSTLCEGGDEGAEGDDRRHPEGHREEDVRVVPAGKAPGKRRPPFQG